MANHKSDKYSESEETSTNVYGEGRHHDRWRRVVGPAGQPLPQLLGDERHERVEQAQAIIEARVQGLLCRLACGGRRRFVSHGLHRFLKTSPMVRFGSKLCSEGIAYDIHVTELVEPKVICGGGRKHEVPVGQMCVDLLRSNIELVQGPLLDKALPPSGLQGLGSDTTK